MVKETDCRKPQTQCKSVKLRIAEIAGGVYIFSVLREIKYQVHPLLRLFVCLRQSKLNQGNCCRPLDGSVALIHSARELTQHGLYLSRDFLAYFGGGIV